ncbi:uncharacterized protein EV422DRAFT_513313 [Fimicolochytrium jonesii]|uniref:uncharacterized protein n=1 Tax=Fimicolochytrium jonesii TaxID=1396493 RepID=UPI0022FE6D93|nr:uncharacterized protein EV422DRAFT_513313 [Fimicolochytrium jonesii]KAI8827295.1 hypothetical protein EV422DRAFT_513313 [Fimicolochytrium jonesii]
MDTGTPPSANVYVAGFLIQITGILVQSWTLYQCVRGLRRKTHGNYLSFDHIFTYMHVLLWVYQLSNLFFVAFITLKPDTYGYRVLLIINDWSYLSLTGLYAGFVIRRYGKVYGVLNRKFGTKWLPILMWVTGAIWCITALPCGIFDLVALIQTRTGVPSWEPSSDQINGVLLIFAWDVYLLIADVTVSSLLYFRLRNTLRDRKGALPNNGTPQPQQPARKPQTSGLQHPQQSRSALWTPDGSTGLVDPTGVAFAVLQQETPTLFEDLGEAKLTPPENSASKSPRVPAGMPPASSDPSTSRIPRVPTGVGPSASLWSQSESRLQPTADNNSTFKLNRLPGGVRPLRTKLLTEAKVALLLRRSTIGIIFLVLFTFLGAILLLVGNLFMVDDGDAYNLGYVVTTQLAYCIPVFHGRFAMIYVKAVKHLTKGLRI